jgi:hypothetical protein
MSTIKDGGPAFPATRYEQVGTLADHGCDDDSPTYGEVSYPGLSLRDWFAGQALTGIADHFTVSNDATTKASQKVIARLCYDYADAMLAAREGGA